MRVHVVGGPTVLLEVGGLRLLTDPTFSPAGNHETTPGRPLTKTEDPAISLATIGSIDAVLLSHDQHADNLDPAGYAVVAAVPLTLTTPAAAERLGGTSIVIAAGQDQLQREFDPAGVTVDVRVSGL